MEIFMKLLGKVFVQLLDITFEMVDSRERRKSFST